LKRASGIGNFTYLQQIKPRSAEILVAALGFTILWLPRDQTHRRKPPPFQEADFFNRPDR
jgi:hypothetical protein